MGPPPPSTPARLRPLVEEDLPRLHSWYQTAELAAHLVGEVAPRGEAEAVAYMRGWLVPTAAAERFAIARTDDGALVGAAALLGIDGRRGELHLFLGDADSRGRGLGRAAVDALLHRAFEGLGLEEVWLEVLATNAAARRLYARAGFVQYGVGDEPAVKAGEPVEVLRMRIAADRRPHR